MEKKIHSKEETLKTRLTAELGLLTLLVLGSVLVMKQAAVAPQFQVPYVVGSCEPAKSHLNYADKNTWCSVQRVTYR